MSAGRQDVVNEYKIPSNYPEHAAVVQIHGPPGLKRGAQVKPAVRPNALVAPVADDIRQAFVQYDSDHSGYIDLRELERVTAALTLAYSPRPLNPSPDPNPHGYDSAPRAHAHYHSLCRVHTRARQARTMGIHAPGTRYAASASIRASSPESSRSTTPTGAAGWTSSSSTS